MEREIRIKTERLTLRPLATSDVPAVVAVLNDYQVSRWLTVVPYPYGAQDARDFLAYLKTSDPLDALAVIAPEGLVGVVGIGGGLGYWLGRVSQGSGYMTEAAGAMVDWFFTHRDADTLTSGYFFGNEASRIVLSKLGFRPDGEKQVKSRAQGTEVTLKKVVLFRADWQVRRGS